MKDEIKEILDDFDYALNRKRGTITLNQKDIKLLLDYITNLQEKSNNQAEEINRLYKQREKFMKKYGYLKEENEKLKELCDKYEEEHSTTFEYWKQLVKADYKEKNEKAKSLTNRTIEIIKQQPSGNDEWILERLNGINYCLGGDEEC